MSYCVVADVRGIVDTNLTDAQITNIITWADDWVDKKIDSGAATAVFLENLSSTYAAYRVMLKDPNARSLGQHSENRSISLKLLKDELDDLIATADGGVAIIAAREELG